MTGASKPRRVLARSAGAVGVAVRQLAAARGRIVLAVAGVATAVLLITLMAGLGHGMTEAGTEALTYIDQDLWATAGPLQLAPGRVGGIENSLLDAHERSDDIATHPDVQGADALTFQSVYLSPTTTEFDTVVGVGVTGNGSGVGLGEGERFNRSDVHYDSGSYGGPMTHEVVLDRDLAEQLNVSRGDSVYVGGTLADARANEFTVVGTTGRFSTFLGAPTAVVHLSELQTVTGTAGSDRASMIGIRVERDADHDATAESLSAEHPDLSIRTQRQQFRSVFENQGAVLASAVTLVTLAVVVGTGLVANTLGLVVYQQRRELAALRAIGLRARTLLSLVGLQGLSLALGGVAVGIALTPVAADAINGVVEDLVGFPDLVKLPPDVYAAGVAVGLVIGLLGATVAGYRVASMNPTDHFDR
ncbi:ABC transporter permease [Halomicrobium urmianum]|uniref:ABC transporter permease n=1 Tax=Halomicrobium urmianum TaxID=1586233 RepID=UPI001CD94EFB|nr:ABC transporter permease [Halomicrobium urmianum]